MRFQVSVNPTCIGKDVRTVGNNAWETKTLDVWRFVESHYIQGQAIAAGVFDLDSPLTKGSTAKTNERWLGSEIVVIDIDEWDNNEGHDSLINDPFIQEHCFAIIPSSSFTFAVPKVHLYFKLDNVITDEKHWRGLSTYVAGLMPVKADPAMSKPAQATFGTRFLKPSMIDHTPTLNDGLCWFNDHAAEIDTTSALIEIARRVNENEHLNAPDDVTDTAINKRALAYYEQPVSTRLRVALDALTQVCNAWGRREYDDWQAMVMSAHHATDGSTLARDILLSNPGVTWKPGERDDFIFWWDKHTPREDNPVTVARLFHYARLTGWLKSTSLEIPEYEVTLFNATEVGDWLTTLDPLPRQALIQSNTGTGKTLGMIALLKKLGTPKSVFFAPSIKLCRALSATLIGQGVENTLYITEDGVTKSGPELAKANVLVTTLQTFATKIATVVGTDLSAYELVFIDECDELISAFVRSGTHKTLYAGSHVRPSEAHWGVKALRDMLRTAQHVIMSDGTATMVTVQFVRACLNSGDTLQIYRNTWKRTKAPVHLIQDISDARGVAFRAVASGKRVVIAIDTKAGARDLHEAMIAKGILDKDEAILITSDTSYKPAVQDFFRDVEKGAAKYRVVIYNSAMGSGVSIVDTKPDVTVQFVQYIAPRKNLQMINRFRQQALVFCYVNHRESLYSEPPDDRKQRTEGAAKSEEILTGVPLQERGEIATLITDIALLSVRDDHEQHQNVKSMYTGLLEQDGREVRDLSSAATDDGIDEALKEARGRRKELEHLARQTWRDAKPITRSEPLDPDATLLEQRQGLIHAQIRKCLGTEDGHEVVMTIDDETLARIVIGLRLTVPLVEKWLLPEPTLAGALSDLGNQDKSILTFRLYLSTLDLVGVVGELFQHTDEVLTDDVLNQRAPKFLREVELRKDVYNTLAGSRNAYDKVLERKGETGLAALAIAKYILKAMGLKVTRTRGHRDDEGNRIRINKIEGTDDVLTLLRMRGNAGDDITRLDFDTRHIPTITDTMKREAPLYMTFTDAEKRRILKRVAKADLSISDGLENVLMPQF